MTIYKYHYGANITVATDGAGAFSTELSGDGVDDMPIHEITRRIEDTVTLLEAEFPDAAFNIGLNFGFTGSGIGEPADIAIEDAAILRNYGESLKMGEPIPPGTYTAQFQGVSQNANGSTTLEFRIDDLDAKGADQVRGMLGKPFPFRLDLPISKDTRSLDEIARHQKEEIDRAIKEREAQKEAEYRKLLASQVPRWAKEDPSGGDPGKDGVILNASKCQRAAMVMNSATGAGYDRCLAMVIDLAVKTKIEDDADD